MRQLFLKGRTRGFTIIELLVVIVVIAILATLAVVAYNGVTSSARDRAVESDAEGVAAEVARYGSSNNGVYGPSIQWYSGGAANANIDFTPSEGNIIDVVASSDDYCVRVYNPNSTTYTNLYNGATQGSSVDACFDLLPSSAAITVNGSAGSTLARMVVTGAEHTCAVTFGGAVYCWGQNTFGQLGNGGTADSSAPVAVDMSGVLSGKTVRSIYTYYNHTCVIASDDRAYCWGYNLDGGLGNGSNTNSSVPVAVSTAGVLAGKKMSKLFMDSSHTCGITTDGGAYCWGNNGSARLGDGSTTNSSVPVAVSTAGVLAGKTIKNISLRGSTACAIASDNNAYCWGSNSFGQLGYGSYSTSLVPTAVSKTGVLSGKTVKAISTGLNFTCVIASDDLPYCWGDGTDGKLGNNATSTSASPVAVNTSGVLSGKTALTIGTSSGTACIIASDRQMYCWGDGLDGKLGNGSTTDALVPVAVTTSGALSGKTIHSMILETRNTCAITADRKVYCWGDGTWGQVGNNLTTDSSLPAAVVDTGVLAGKSIYAIDGGWTATGQYIYFCALTDDKRIACWGNNNAGKLGNGTTTNALAPVAPLNL